MIFIPGYKINEMIHRGDRTSVYRGYRQRDRQPVVIKINREDYSRNSLKISGLKHEYLIAKNLKNTGLIKIYEMVSTDEGMLALILEDFGGESLINFLSNNHLDCLDFLPLAIQLTESVGQLHQAQIIHQEINPSNILINPSAKTIKITDFGIAVMADYHDLSHISYSNLRSETLAYMSPEQTGRMNRSIDYRTDFYSLGMTFYQMLTGTLPFQAHDPLEWIHCHIAKPPKTPHHQNSNIPETVSNIVLKLLAKNAEDRYQSVEGIKADLQTCLERLKSTGTVEKFPLGQQDIACKFQIPQKLYGRDKELATLMGIFNKIKSSADSADSAPADSLKKSSGISELILISGYSGIGKSALVREMHKPIVANRGYFMSGKFDQYQRNIPYSAFVNAVQELICQILTESEVKLKAWQEKILAKLGKNAQVMVEAIPELELMIGKQPPVKQLGDTESENRFNLSFLQLISVFSQEHPLVIFLDDLQWADSASLKLLELFIGDRPKTSEPLTREPVSVSGRTLAPTGNGTIPDSGSSTTGNYPNNLGSLSIVGAYRTGDRCATDPWPLTLDRIQSRSHGVTEIELRPLTMDAIEELIGDTLQCSPEWSQPLTELLFKKTSGNPFFLKQLLQSLYEQNLLTYNQNSGRWQWDLQQIEALEITEHIEEFIRKKLQKLPPDSLKILKIAACMGNRFNLESLAIVNQMSVNITASQLQPAIQAELIVPQGDSAYAIAMLNDSDLAWVTNNLSSAQSPESKSHKEYFSQFLYKFLHDRVQQAVYSLISADDLAQLHLQIGHMLLQKTQPEKRYENIFEIVNQINLGVHLITEFKEKHQLASLNLIAGQKAKATNAYEAALGYFTVGLKLLAEEGWQTHYDLTLVLHIEALQAAYLNLEFPRVEPLSQVILQNAKTTLERVKVYELKIQFYIGVNQIDRAVNTGLNALAELNIDLPQQPSQVKELWEWDCTKLALGNKGIDRLKKLPLMTDPYKLAAMRILGNLAAPTFHLNPRLFCLVGLSMVKLSLKYGNSPFSAYGYGIYGSMLCTRWQALSLGNEFGKLSLSLLEKLNCPELKARVHHTFNAQVKFGTAHLRETIEPLRQTVQWGLESGDFEYVGYGSADYCIYQFFLGENLLVVSQQCKQYIELLDPLQQNLAIAHLKIWRKVALTLSADSNGAAPPLDDIDILCVREESSQLMNQVLHQTSAIDSCSVPLAKIILAYLLNQPDVAEKMIELSAAADPGLDLLGQVQLNFYTSLVLLMQARHLPKKERGKRLKTVAANQQRMKQWAAHGPSNFQHKYDLVAGETARLLGDANRAIAAYDRAIIGATKHGYTHEAAIANQRAGEFYLERGNEKIGRIYLRDAYDGYLNWGANSIVKQLEAKYEEVFCRPPIEIPREPEPIAKAIEHPTTTIVPSSLDLSTAIKASQALASEMRLEKLIEQLMNIVMENAAATSASLILKSQGTWAIVARAILDRGETIIGDNSPVDRSEHLPRSAIEYAIETGVDLVLNHATVEEPFCTDPYIQRKQPKSILCTRILHQGKLLGLLYLENEIASSAFTSESVEILKLLSSQVAICLENAQLYANVDIRQKRLRQQSSTLLKLSQRNHQKTSRELRKVAAPLEDIFGLATRNYQKKTDIPPKPPIQANRRGSGSKATDRLRNSSINGDRSNDLLSSVQEIIEASAKTMDIERVSVWLYNEQRSRIKCLDLYERSSKRHSCRMDLHISKYPIYFRILSMERIIAAHDARSDLRTAELRENYLIPEGITSILEAPIRVGGQMVGILRHEHVGPARHWEIEEENFAASLADLVALAIERSYRAKAEQERDRFFSLSQDLLCVIDFQGQFTQLNPAWEKTLAISSQKMLGKRFIEFVHPEDRETTQVAVEKLVSRQEIISFENRYRCADGSYRWLFWNATPDLERQLIYAVVHDITYRVEAEAALKQANEDLELRVEERTAELQEAIASLKDTNKQLHDEIIFRKTTEEALRYSQELLKEQTHELQDALDRLQRTQIQLVQNEKMASLGQLVAGIAHEINNPVSFIYSNIDPLSEYIHDLLDLLELYQQEYPQPHPTIEEEIEAIELDFLIEDLPKLLESIKSGADRIRKIVISLRNFSRLDEAAKKRVNLHEGIESTLLILQNQIKDIEIIKDFGELPKIECYSAEINQAMMNILANAIDAVTPKKSRRRITTDKATEKEDSLPTSHSPRITIRTELTHADSVKITIADNGVGIPENIKSRIFDPFFTTKDVGSGTGLGLSVSYQIVVKKHQGKLSCNSQPGEGTEFAIELPIRLPL